MRKTQGVGVTKERELKLEGTEASHTLGGAGEDRVQGRGKGIKILSVDFLFFLLFCFLEFVVFLKNIKRPMCTWGNETSEQGREKCTSHQRIGTDRTSHDISTGHSITFTIDAGSLYKHSAWSRSHETGRRTGIVLRGWSLVLTVTAAVASFSTISGHCILF